MLPNGTNQHSRHLPPRRTASEIVQSIAHPHPSKTDPYGSYTGISVNPHEIPQQDADDL